MFTPTYFQRFVIFALLLTLPILRLVLTENYGLIHPEVGVVVFLAIGCSAALAAVSFKPLLFHSLAVGTVVLFSVNAIQVDMFPEMRMRWIISGTMLVLAAATWLGRENYYKILCVFVVGSFSVDVGKNLLSGFEVDSGQEVHSTAKPRHIVHIILDEIIGLAALPEECVSCQTARGELLQILHKYQFRIYPYASSNYRSTRDSIPSILNGRLLSQTNQFFKNGNARPFLHHNAYFDRYLANHYDVRVYQSDYILYSSPKYPLVAAHTYSANSLNTLNTINLHWRDKLRQLISLYILSDRFWNGILRRVVPLELYLKQMPVGSLSVQEVWPKKILDEIHKAPKQTLFFAHLLIPHYPYVYRSDGSLRKPSEWLQHRLLFYTNEENRYWSEYEHYGEQVRFVGRQIESFLDGLRKTENYESTTVIIHGDHGSRLRLLKDDRAVRAKLAVDTPDCAAVNRYDYASEPNSFDLRNRFATLLAIKFPGASEAEIVDEKGSVLYFLSRDFLMDDRAASQKGVNSMYLFDPLGRPVEISLERLWSKGE